MIEHSVLLIALTCAIGFIMTWSIGANDLANIMSTSLGSKAITVRQALFIAIIFELAGAILGSTDVTRTIRSGIINTQLLADSPNLLTYGMLAVLCAGTSWMLLASFLGLPVSITNATVGGLVGLGAIALGVHTIHWQEVERIALSWLTAPFFAGTVAYGLFRSIQSTILMTIRPIHNTWRYLPIYFFLVGIVLAFMTVLKGIKHFDIQLSLSMSCLITFAVATAVTVVGMLLSKRTVLAQYSANHHGRFAPVERLFGLLMAFTACAMVFAHGSNDVAIAVGPMTAIINIVQSGASLQTNTPLPGWVVLLGGIGVITGLVMYGRKVIATVGSGITTLTPSRAFAATLSAASTVIVFTSMGIPVSATQTLVGAVLGVGLARGIGALNLYVVRNILLSWLITIPAASVLAIAYFYLFKNIFA